MNRYRYLALVLLVALASGRLPAAAQERGGAPLPDTTALALVFIVFPDETGAQQAITDLNQSDTTAAGRIEDYAVMSRGQDGKVQLQQSSTGDAEPSGSPRAENAVNGVVAHWVAGGDNAPDHAGVSEESTNKMRDLLKPGTSAVVAVTAEPYLPSVVTSLQKGDTTQVVEANVAAPGASNPNSEQP
jgi:hypothetical protein